MHFIFFRFLKHILKAYYGKSRFSSDILRIIFSSGRRSSTVLKDLRIIREKGRAMATPAQASQRLKLGEPR